MMAIRYPAAAALLVYIVGFGLSADPADSPAGVNTQAQDGLLLREFEPRSMLVTTVTEVPKARFPVIDVHSHLGRLERADEWIRLMDATNVAQVVNLGLDAGIGPRRGPTLEQTMEALSGPKYKGRFIHLANVDFRQIDRPDFPQWAAAELERAVRQGARGLKIFKSLGLAIKDASGRLVPVDDPRLDPIWAKAGELGVPVLIHVSDPAAFFTPLDRFNERYEELIRQPTWHFPSPPFPSKEEILAQRDRMLARHPNTTFVGLHVGNFPEHLEYVSSVLDAHPNFHVEISARHAELGRQPRRARAFFLEHQDRIMFGIDGEPDGSRYPIYFRFLETDDEYFDYHPTRPTQGRWQIYGIHLPDEVLEKVYYANARRIFPEEPAP